MEQQIIDALTALTGQRNLNQQAQTEALQQLHVYLWAQQQAQQDMINQLAAIQGQQQPVAQQLQTPRSSAVNTIPQSLSKATDSLADWLSALNRTAVAERWDDDVKPHVSVAVGKLVGLALQWQDLTGNWLADWDDWLTALQATFQPRLSLVEWYFRVEQRVQFCFSFPTEPGAQYALEKMKICRLCPHQLPGAEIVNYLSKDCIT